VVSSARSGGAASTLTPSIAFSRFKLLADPRVTNFEKMNARHLTVGDLPRAEFDAVVTDLSFISLKVVLPAIWPFVRPGGVLVALVKPQFEAGKAEVDKGRGVIRDPAVQQAVLDDIRTFATGLLRGATLIGTIDSPITGTDGNREFLLGLRRSS
jgi:23S rRNA (cytidine1920-2'-O)/16S rRNA (cytidine1409-2'-O)-methyltransferase